ncbi:MAG: GntR family transcriptional regulator [Pseudomonadota bacterium]
MKADPINKSPPLREQVYSAVLSQLRGGAYAPGERITEGRVGGDLGVSRTPVREALSQLYSDGLIIARDKGGYEVPNPTNEEVEDILTVRRLLEPHALALAATEYDDVRLKMIEKAIEQERKFVKAREPDNFIQANQAYRSALFDGISNQMLKSLISQFGFHLQFLRSVTLRNVEIRSQIVENHQAIRDAIYKRDADGAARLWNEFLNFTKESLLASMRDPR